MVKKGEYELLRFRCYAWQEEQFCLAFEKDPAQSGKDQRLVGTVTRDRPTRLRGDSLESRGFLARFTLDGVSSKATPLTVQVRSCYCQGLEYKTSSSRGLGRSEQVEPGAQSCF